MLFKLKDIYHGLFRKSPSNDSAAMSVSSNKELLRAYLSYRAIVKELNIELVKCVPKEVIRICGKSLGIVRGKALSSANNTELDVLIDYCIYHHYIGSKNVINRYIATNRRGLSGDKEIVALAMEQAQFAILEVARTMPYGGILVIDLLRGGKQELLMDRNFSQTAIPGTVMASTIMRYPQFITTTGASLPLSVLYNFSEVFESLMESCHKKYKDFDSMPKIQQSKLISNLLKICFREEVMENITYK